MTNKFNASVTTIILCDGAPELRDKIEFLNVDRSFVEFLAGSCRMVLRKLFESPQESEGPYAIHYETIITDASTAEVIRKLPPVTTLGMTREKVYAFLKLAMLELAEANDLRYGEFSCRSGD